jgi:hypothetical protein
MRLRIFAGLMLLLCAPISALADCASTSPHRQQSRLYGAWEHYLEQDGAPVLVGESEVAEEVDGCAFTIRFTGVDGHTETALVFYEVAESGWKEYSVASTGQTSRYLWKAVDHNSFVALGTASGGPPGGLSRRKDLAILRRDELMLSFYHRGQREAEWRLVSRQILRKVH